MPVIKNKVVRFRFIRKLFYRRLLRYFFQGVIFVLPIYITAEVLRQAFFKVDNGLDGILPVKIPGLGLLVIIISLIILGYLGSRVFMQPIVDFIEDILEKTPVIKDIYGAIRDFLSAFVGKKKKFDKPVIVIINKESNVRKIGFITREDLSLIGIGTGFVAVYCPHSYAFSGELIIVPIENVQPIEKHSGEAMKFVVSGGVIEMNEETKN